MATGYANAGQVCISAQRILVDSQVYPDYLDLLKQGVEGIVGVASRAVGQIDEPLVRQLMAQCL